MYVCVWSGVWGVDRGWVPLLTRPQQYCDPPLLVQFYHQMDISELFLGTVKCIFLGPILVPNFFRNYQKMTIFDMFPFYHVTSNSHISAIFWKYGMKFFGEPLEMFYQQNRRKKFGFHDHFILFLGQWTQKNDFFGAIFGFCGQNSLWSRLGRATKF